MLPWLLLLFCKDIPLLQRGVTTTEHGVREWTQKTPCIMQEDWVFVWMSTQYVYSANAEGRSNSSLSIKPAIIYNMTIKKRKTIKKERLLTQDVMCHNFPERFQRFKHHRRVKTKEHMEVSRKMHPFLCGMLSIKHLKSDT